MPKVIDQLSTHGCLSLRIDTDVPFRGWVPVMIDGVKHEQVPAFHVGKDCLIIMDNGNNYIGSEVEFIDPRMKQDQA
jgi:hypothetical protein